MQIYLFRHGIAEDAEAGQPDSDRKLTDEGREKLSDVLKVAKRTGVEPGLILSSPYLRARQTAKLAAEHLSYKGEIVSVPALVPHSSPEDVWTELRNHLQEDAILLASHEPLLSSLTAFLLNSPELRVEMKKAALVRIDVAGLRGKPHGVLHWMITPKVASNQHQLTNPLQSGCELSDGHGEL